MISPTLKPSAREAIEARIAAEDEAWARGDAADYSRWVAADCVFTNIFGQVFVGREAFEAQHDRVLSTIYKGTELHQTIGHLRLIRPDVAIVDTAAVVTGLEGLPPGLQSEDGGLHAQLLQVFVLEAGEWWVTTYHNVDVKPPPPLPRRA